MNSCTDFFLNIPRAFPLYFQKINLYHTEVKRSSVPVNYKIISGSIVIFLYKNTQKFTFKMFNFVIIEKLQKIIQRIF